MASKLTKEYHETNVRSLCKALSWRVLGSLGTGTIVFVATGDAAGAALVGSVEFLLKIFLYYFHERLWDSINIGRFEVQKREQVFVASGEIEIPEKSQA